MDLTITQNFLSELLYDTDKHALLNPTYESKEQFIRTEMFVLSSMFTMLMEDAFQSPKYGVIGGVDEKLREALADKQYADQPESVRDIYQTLGKGLDEALNDPATRALIVFLIQASAMLKDAREKKDQATDTEGRDQT